MRALSKPLIRKVAVKGFRRPLIIIVTETGNFGLRELRSRRTFWTSLGVVFYRVIREEAEKEQAARKAARAAARKGGHR